jgi:RNA polymerase sigma factor (sigma-70 family)
MKLSNDTGQIEIWNKFILDGDQDALSQIYFHYYDLLFDYGQKHTSDKQLVEDVIQDIFINFIKVRKRIGNVKNLGGYLLTTFRRQLYLDLNKQRKLVSTEQLPEEQFDYYKSPEQEDSDQESMERVHSTIRECIGKLTAKQKEMIYLRFEREISYEEIAQTLNISVDSCYKSTYRSIKIIRSEVEKIFGKGANILLFSWFRTIRRAIQK